VIPEKSKNNQCDFLEGCFQISNEHLSAFFKNKNFDSLLCTGTLKYVTTQDFFSFAGSNHYQMKTGIVMGRMMTMLTYCHEEDDVIKSFAMLLCQLVYQGYPKKVITKACRNMFVKHKKPIFQILEGMTKIVFEQIISK
jgi:hypothetical protein